jgi:hypothetical protein
VPYLGCVFNHLTTNPGRTGVAIFWRIPRWWSMVIPVPSPWGYQLPPVPVTGLQGTQQAEDILPQVTLDLHLRGWLWGKAEFYWGKMGR